MRWISAVALVLTLAIGLGALPASAQPQPQPQPQSPQPSTDDERARSLFLEGEAHYAAGRYELAAERYLEAYELSQRPELLFNLGNAYERLGDYAKAAQYLSQYVASPRARDVVSVRERIRRLEAAAAEQLRRAQQEQQEQQEVPRADSADTADTADSAGSAVTASPPPRPTASDRCGRATWWLIGSGASAAGAIGMGLLALNAGSNAARRCADDGRPVCLDTASSALTQETVFAIGADVLAVATVVTAGVGIYLLFQDDAQDDDQTARPATTTRLAPTLGPDGLGVSLSGRF
jgi:tetratricopeptide (TPR) repeat protein